MASGDLVFVDTGAVEVLADIESERMVSDLAVMAGTISVSPCADALDLAGSLAVKVVVEYLLLKV